MTDEKFVFVSDVRDKKRTARGSFNKRSHAGKGGAVKFPSDYLTRKEKEAMNGEVKSYRLNSPMDWKSFRAMPDDIKVLYIRGIRERYGATNTNIAEMLGIHKVNFAREVSRLGLNAGHRRSKPFDGEGWCRWIHGVAEDHERMMPCDMPEQENPKEEFCVEAVKTAEEDHTQEPAIPANGNLYFECNATIALQTINRILQDSCVKLSVVWERLGDGVQNG